MTIFLQPLYIFFGSLPMGTVLAYGLHYVALTRHQTTQYKLALVIGVVIKSLEQESIISEIEFCSAFELFFIVLFDL